MICLLYMTMDFLKTMVLFALVKQHIVQSDGKWGMNNKTKQYIFPLCWSHWSDHLGLLFSDLCPSTWCKKAEWRKRQRDWTRGRLIWANIKIFWICPTEWKKGHTHLTFANKLGGEMTGGRTENIGWSMNRADGRLDRNSKDRKMQGETIHWGQTENTSLRKVARKSGGGMSDKRQPPPLLFFISG